MATDLEKQNLDASATVQEVRAKERDRNNRKVENQVERAYIAAESITKTIQKDRGIITLALLEQGFK